MKLQLETHKEYVKLKEYFKKIESLAEKMGVDIDDLLLDSKNNRVEMHTSFRSKVNKINQHRSGVIKNENNSERKDESHLADFTILINTKKIPSSLR